MTETTRRFDIVLWGASGFAGRLVAEYLAEVNGTDGSDGSDELSWAIAGRNREKLAAVRAGLDLGEADQPEILIGDAFDRDRLVEIAGQTAVVCSTVGPYATFGSELVAACVEQETDYCDLTGEVHWIREMIDRHHSEAKRREARIVHCCGFDSIPSDLGVYALQRQAFEAHGRLCDSVRMVVRGASGGVSGGTLASMANLFEEAGRNPEIRRILADPYSLSDEGKREGPDSGWQKGVRWDEDAETWTAPFLMASVNEKIVRRTNSLCGEPYGTDFRYGESMGTGAGVSGWTRAAGVAAGITAFSGAMALKPTRALLERFVFPEQGEGPDRDDIENGYFSLEFIGRGNGAGAGDFTVRQKVRGSRDPGYGATATMLGESARLLAEEAAGDLDNDASGALDGAFERCAGGVLTPAAAMGHRLVDRLDEAGIDFESK